MSVTLPRLRSQLLFAAVFLGLAAPSLAAPSANVAYRAFRSPTGAITCGILNMGGRNPNHFASCASNYTDRQALRGPCGAGSEVTIDQRGWAHLIPNCNAFGSHLSPLAYGDTLRMGDFRCFSEPTGITCLSLASGHGFRLNRDSLRRF